MEKLECAWIGFRRDQKLLVPEFNRVGSLTGEKRNWVVRLNERYIISSAILN